MVTRLAILIFAVVWVAIGALLLPRKQLPQARAESDHLTAVVADSSGANPITESKTSPAEAALAKVEPLLLPRPRYEAPMVAGQPMANDHALQLAAGIDRELDRSLVEAKVPASAPADDAEFLRRVYLDLTGKIPSHKQALAFLSSQDTSKRAHLIDELLASPNFGRHFAHVWADMIIKRDFENNKNMKTEAFVDWLAARFNQDGKWDQIVRDLLTAQGTEEENPATLFVLANQDNNQPAPNKLVGATGNLFMGIQVQCAECHVHPFNKNWTTNDFWGMAAFFGHTRAEHEGNFKKKQPLGPATIVEADREPTMTPRKKGQGNKQARPLPVGATIAIPDPTDPKKTIKTVAARYFEGAEADLGQQGPYRPALAAWVTSSRDRYFAPAMANRLWAHFFARGLVNPVDDMLEDNAPSNPELLKLLASEFAGSGYDIKFLVRALCNSRAYQRTSRPLPENTEDERLFSHMPVKVLSAQVLLDSLAIATGQDLPGPAVSGARTKKQGGKNKGGELSLARFFDTQEFDSDATEYSSGVPQVLRLMNSNLASQSAELIRRQAKSPSQPERIIDELYVTALARHPSAAETKVMGDYAAKQGDPARGCAGVFWVLLNSAEFACNR